MVTFLAERAIPTLVVLTKMDKLKRSQRKGHIQKATEALGIDEEQVVPFSSKTGEGKDALLGALKHLLKAVP